MVIKKKVLKAKANVSMVTLTPKKARRLEPHVRPIRYDVTLAPDLESHAFTGEVHIELDVQKATRSITLHATDLKISRVYITKRKEEEDGEIMYDAPHEMITCTFANKIPIGKERITFIFSGVLNDSMRGFYKARYMVDGSERIMATTQFEATDARRCIPCFDEPAHKAVFAVTLVIPTGKEAISNTLPVAIWEHSFGYKAVSFADTPQMSTYLLAFIVGDFEYLEHTTERGVEVRIMTTPGKKEQGKFALDVTVRCLAFYESYFGIPYPLNTLDMIAIPDFESGAMENWGAITYRETVLLIDEVHSSIANKQRVAIVICHELAHQWFGNLVTMEWWNDLWLNEGFASYMEYLATDTLFPEWNIWSHFLSYDHAYALQLDGLHSTHPIDVPVHNPHHIGEIFDAISYSKGASLIRQLAEYIGHTAFQKGLQFYLKKHSYKNTQTIHLWDAFEKYTSAPVGKIMSAWTKKSGYPQITITRTAIKCCISQERFYTYKTERQDKTVWPIPIAFTDGVHTTKPILVTKKKQYIVDVPLSYKPNAFETGFYRTQYSPLMLEALAPSVCNKTFSIADRFGIIRDVCATLDASSGDIQATLSFLMQYKNETEYVLWIEICSALKHIHHFLVIKKEEATYALYVQDLLSSVFLHVGFTPYVGEVETMPLLRALIVDTLGYFNDKKVLVWATEIFDNRAHTAIHPNVRSVVYSIVAKNRGSTVYNDFVQMYEKEENHQEKIRILRSIGECATKAEIMKKALMYMCTDSVRLQDKIYLFNSVARTHEGLICTFDFLKKNQKRFQDIMGTRGIFRDFIEVCGRFSTKAQYSDTKQFFTKLNLGGTEMTLAQTLEHIQLHIRFIKTYTKPFKIWIKGQEVPKNILAKKVK